VPRAPAGPPARDSTAAPPAEGSTAAPPAEGSTTAPPAEGSTTALPDDGSTTGSRAQGSTAGQPATGDTTAPGLVFRLLPRARVLLAPFVTPLVGLLAVVIAAVVHVLVSRSLTVPSGAGEAAVGANAYGLSELGGFPVAGSLSDRLLSLHVALYGELTGATGRYDSVAGAVREFVLLAAIVGALALFTLCRQLGLSTAAALGAVLLAAVAPALVAPQLLLGPATVATTWLLLAAVLVAAKPAAAALTWAGWLAAATLITVATMLAPVAILLPAGVLVVALLAGVIFPKWGGARRLPAAFVLLAGVALVALTALRTFGALEQTPVPTTTAVILAVVGLVLAPLAAWQVRWIRPLAVACGPVFVLALLPLAAQPAAVVLSIPLVAILLVALVEETVLGGRWSAMRRRIVAAAVVVVAVVGVALLPVAGTIADTRGVPPEELAGWLVTNTDPGTAVQVSPLLWVELRRAGVPAQRLQRTDDPAADGPVPILLAERGETNGALPLMARFGTGELAIAVRERMPDTAATAEARDADQQASAAFGQSLADNPNVVLQGVAGPDLGSGLVDARLLTVLATAAADFTFTIQSFPRVNGGPDIGTLRTVRLSGIEPSAGGDVEAAGIALRDYFRYQLPDYRPLVQGFDDGALVVTYSAPSPIGLLG